LAVFVCVLSGAGMADSQASAAIKLQAFARAVLARQRVRAIIHSMYEKPYDESTGSFYYFNTKSGESTCEARTKPVVSATPAV
jgi:hypothetical protein